MAGWKRKFPLCDPFCGSGTILAEAALYAWDAAPGLGRHFALEKLALSDKAVEARVRAELRDAVDTSRVVRIAGSDVDEKAVSLAEANLRRALRLTGAAAKDGAAPRVRVLPAEAAAPQPGWDGGFIVTNPPYGKRLGDEERTEALYKSMGGLAERFPGWKLCVLSDHAGFESLYGKKADSCREIKAGAENVYFYQFNPLNQLNPISQITPKGHGDGDHS
jgi:putative N6-adenine-specific DNA methylase